MSDSFNPHEILSRLRSTNKATTAASMTNVNPTVSSTNTGYGSSQSVANNTANQQTAPPSAAKEKFLKATKAITATLAMNPHRQDGSSVRTELEKEIKKLQDEITTLKAQNKQLQSDKEDVERQFIEFKIKSEDLVTKLRGKIAALSLAQQRSGVDGPGKMYPPAPPSQHLPRAAMRAANATRYAIPSPPPPLGPSLSHSAEALMSPDHGLHYQPEGFREPTFSELMRRSTPEHSDFKESLRKAASVKGTVAKSVPQPQSSQKNLHMSYDMGSTPNNMNNVVVPDQYDFYGSPMMGMAANKPTMNFNSSGPLNTISIENALGSSGGMSGYIHPSLNQELMPEFDHSLPIVEIDLSKQ